VQQKSKEQGFGTVPIVLAVAVVCLIGGVGWYVWQQAQKRGMQASSTTGQNNQAGKNNNSTDPSEGGKYLVIREWGVRFRLEEMAKGQALTYKYDGSDSSNVNHSDIASISFIVPETSELYYCMNIHIDREAEAYASSSVLAGFPVIGTIDGYMYYQRRMPSYCGSKDSQLTQDAEALMNELATSLDSLEKI